MQKDMIEVLAMQVDWQRLRQSSEAVLMLRVASAVNDIDSANHFMYYCTVLNPKMPEHLKNGFHLYGLRLRCGHLHEALELISKIKKTQSLQKYFKQFEPKTTAQWELLLGLLNRGADFKDAEKYISNVRNKMTFHYDPNEIKQALNNIADDLSSTPSEVIVSQEKGYSRFVLADDVMRRELCQVIWGVNVGTDDEVIQALNEALDWTGERIKAFRDVGECLCSLYFLDFAVEVPEEQ